MKLTVSLRDFRDAVTWAARALPATPLPPVMAGMLLTATDTGTLTVSAFDLDTAATATTTAQVDEPGTALLSGSLLRNLSRALRGDTAEITASGDDGGEVALRCDNADLALRTLPADQYPALPAPPEPAGTTHSADLAAAIAAVAPAASDDPHMAILCAVHLAATPNGLRLEATNRYHAADALIPWQPALTAPETDALIPARLLTAITKDLGDNPVTILASPPPGPARLAGITIAGRTLITRCAEAQNRYPDLTLLYPAEPATTITVTPAALAAAIRAVTLLLDDGGKNLPVTLDATSDSALAIRAPGGQRGSGTVTIPAAIDGPPATTQLNPHYLLTAITPAGDRCQISLHEPSKPALITPAAPGGTPAYRHLIMPVR